MNQELNPEQQQAVGHVDGPLLVLAGAGAGKTRVVTLRIARLLQLGVPPSEILAVTFTNKAAAEMQERVSRLTSQQVLICTFHSLGARILRQSIGALGYPEGLTIYDAEDSEKLLRNCMDRLGIKTTEIKPKVFRTLISDAKNRLLNPDEIDLAELNSPKEKLFPELYALYQSRLREYNAVDFDDLLATTVRLFRERPDVLEWYRSQWSYLLIDEYQDINFAQYEMARLLTGDRCNLFVVGDPDQSIYSWRGANIQNILNFERDYPGATVVRLEQNYRSTSTILEAANAVIKNNEGRYEKSLWSTLGKGELIQTLQCESDREEAQFVADRIATYVNKQRLSPTEIAIFYRTNAQSRQLEDALLRAQIPYQIIGGFSFYQRREVKEVLSFLRMIQSDSDFLAFARTINLPKRGIGESTLEKIAIGSSEAKMGVLDYCRTLLQGGGEMRLPQKQREGLTDYLLLIDELRKRSKELSLFELVSETIHRTGYLQVLRADEESYQDRKANLDELVGKAAEWEEGKEGGSLEEFLEELSLRGSSDEGPTHAESVRLMTLHNGKGLEFQVVFLVGMEEGLFPHANSRATQEQLEEERRLCYVGMTRAKQTLYITSAQSRFLWGTIQYMRPSRFLKEIPPQYTEPYRRTKSAQVVESRAHEEAEFQVGDRVSHAQFGQGTVQDLSYSSLGLAYKILFDSDRTPKTLVAKFAKLK